MSELERPSVSDRPPVGGLTSTVRPAGVSALAVSGAGEIFGPNPRCSQPVSPTGSPVLGSSSSVESSIGACSGCCHELARSLNFNGDPHWVGKVKNGFKSGFLICEQRDPASSTSSNSVHTASPALRKRSWL